MDPDASIHGRSTGLAACDRVHNHLTQISAELILGALLSAAKALDAQV
jgi:hypothetical protein